ncbi:hypothetical protein BDQ17DRAFT_1345086 [Cyathus striatus]|nr:hypothetical protein BDQ17DRAFT_1345086 [Cyathus striatus]
MSTRQTTPGPSTAIVQSLTAKKRSSSSELEQPRDHKKSRRDLLAEPTSPKRRRKKKKKMPIAATVQSHQPQQGRQPMSALESMRPVGTPTLPSLNKSEELRDMQVDFEDQEHTVVSSSSDKGKGKATTPTSLVIVRLKEELAQKSALLSRHQSNLSSLQQSLTCEICLDLLYKPFALSPCGHVACHPCLVRWFTAPAPGVVQNPLQRVLNHMRGPGTNHIFKRKTCPVCRTIVQDRPVEVWGLKSMVAALAKSASWRRNPPTGNTNNDPWHNIFQRPHPRVYNNHQTMGIDFDMFPRWFFNATAGRNGLLDEDIDDEDVDAVITGVRDDEDGGIYRCPRCFNEIWNGTWFDSDDGVEDGGDGEDSHVEDEDSDEDGDDEHMEHGWFAPRFRSRRSVIAARGRGSTGNDGGRGEGIRVRYGGPFDHAFVDGEVEPYPGDEAMGLRFNFDFRPVHGGERHEDDGGEEDGDDEESEEHFDRRDLMGGTSIIDWIPTVDMTDEEEGIGRIEEVEDEDANVEDEEESEYDGSFIDDDDDDVQYDDRGRRVLDIISSGRRYGTGTILDLVEADDDDIIEISDGSEDEDEDEDGDNDHIYSTLTCSIERDKDRTGNSDIGIGGRGRRHRSGRIVDTDSEVDVDGDDGAEDD